MIEKIKELAGMAFGFLIFIAMMSLPFVFIKGSVWASAHLLSPLIVVGWVLLAINIVLLLPLSIFKRLRGITGGGIFLSSFIFGLVSWLLGFILTYSIWGIWAVVIGIFFLGFGVVPIALLATAINGYWDPFFTVLVLIILTFGARIVGLLIAESGE
jgi:hypothetical protein